MVHDGVCLLAVALLNAFFWRRAYRQAPPAAARVAARIHLLRLLLQPAVGTAQCVRALRARRLAAYLQREWQCLGAAHTCDAAICVRLILSTSGRLFEHEQEPRREQRSALWRRRRR